MSTDDQEAAAIERRKHTRKSVLWNAKLTCKQYGFDCRVYDISSSGMRVRLDLPLSVGAEVSVQHERYGNFLASVSWSGNGLMGIQFYEEVTEKTRDPLEDSLIFRLRS